MCDQERINKHYAFVALFPCLVINKHQIHCNQPPQIHHLMRADGIKGLALKLHPKWSTPFCMKHHVYGIHEDGDEIRYIEKHTGKTYEEVKELALTLWDLSGKFNEIDLSFIAVRSHSFV